MELKVGDQIRIKDKHLNGYGELIINLHQDPGYIVVSRIRQCGGASSVCERCTTNGMVAEFQGIFHVGFCFLTHNIYTVVNRISYPKTFKEYYKEELKRREDKLWYDNATPLDRLKKKLGYIG